MRFDQEPPADSPESVSPRLVFSATTRTGVALEVMAVELEDDSLLVIHAMPLRERYQGQYEEAKKWRE